MPLAILIALFFFGAMFVLMSAGLEALKAFALVLTGIVFIQLITMSLLMLIVRDKQILKEEFLRGFHKSLDEIKSFFNFDKRTK